MRCDPRDRCSVEAATKVSEESLAFTGLAQTRTCELGDSSRRA